MGRVKSEIKRMIKKINDGMMHDKKKEWRERKKEDQYEFRMYD